MAAYGAVVSLMHILDLIKNHPSPPITLDKLQLHSLTEIVAFLQEFLEGYMSPFSNNDEADPLEIRIAEAVYAAEDVIESYIVDSIHLAAASTTQDDDEDNDEDDDDDNDDADGEVMESYIVDNIHPAAGTTHGHEDEDEQIRYINFYEDLEKVIGAMDLIKKVAEMEMVREKGRPLEAEMQRKVSVDAAFISSSNESKIEMVGFDVVRLQLLDRLTGGDSNRLIIPIVGMGGIGKTTLARNVFANQLIKEHFDICVWATISLDHNIERTLREVLSQSQGRGHLIGEKSVAELGEELHKYLFGKRYLVVMDDMWSIEVWDKIRNFFPECNQRSRVLVTTRMSNLAAHLTNSSNSICMSFLNEVDSWTLFSNTVFGTEGSVPHLQLQLREIGVKIVAKCKGLPLSIAVIGGLLAKSERTQGYWKYIEYNLNSIVNLENEEYCFRVLKLSYNHLPAYLKPCFLYMGVFVEDCEIKVSTIINLWVSEGFVKPKKEKFFLETVAREYFQELVDRNLVLALSDDEAAHLSLRSVGNMIKLCKMHDLVRDVSLREAQRQRFYHVLCKHDSSSHGNRHIVIPTKTRDFYGKRIPFESWPNSRSYVCHDHNVRQFPNSRLLRTLHTPNAGDVLNRHTYSQKEVFGLVNSRLLAIAVEGDERLHSSISRLWSLHTLLVYSEDELEGPIEFWNMHQLKHVEFTSPDGRLRLRLPPNNDDNIVILENLHTLIGVKDFRLNENVVRRMPNLSIFDVKYEEKLVNREVHCLSYLQRLTKLQSFCCSIKEESGEDLQTICFPQSLNQILLVDDYVSPHIEMEGILQKLGWLPFLEEVAIEDGFFGRGEWETIEGQFPRLKSLQLMGCDDMKKWTVSDASHFPLLQKLILKRMRNLEEIPSEIGEVANLKSIQVFYCGHRAVLSAKKIVEEQEDLHGEEQLSFRVLVEDYHSKALASLASPNFQVRLHKVRRPIRRIQRKSNAQIN